MAVDIARFLQLRPYLYHVTARENLDMLADTMRLEPAASLMRRSGRNDLLRWRRSSTVRLTPGVGEVVLKDQAPLIEENVALTHGWTFADFVEYLNEHVFFWPGTAVGPIKAGVRLHGHYENALPLVIRASTSDLLAANPDAIPLFCALNSGAPRQQGGRRVARGPHLFTIGSDFPRREREVVELAFRSGVELPDGTSVASAAGWRPLRDLLPNAR